MMTAIGSMVSVDAYVVEVVDSHSLSRPIRGSAPSPGITLNSACPSRTVQRQTAAIMAITYSNTTPQGSQSVHAAIATTASTRCGARHAIGGFVLGEALHSTQSQDLKKSLRHIIDGVRTRRAVTDTIELTSIATGTYYSRLFRISARLRDYQAWRNVRLLRKEFGNSNKPIRIFTDTLQVSLQRWGECSPLPESRYRYIGSRGGEYLLHSRCTSRVSAGQVLPGWSAAAAHG